MITRIELQQYRRMTDHHRRSPEARAFRRRLEAALKGMQRDHQRIIVFRYCLRMSWRAISMRMNYSERSVFRLNANALNELERSE